MTALQGPGNETSAEPDAQPKKLVCFSGSQRIPPKTKEESMLASLLLLTEHRGEQRRAEALEIEQICNTQQGPRNETSALPDALLKKLVYSSCRQRIPPETQEESPLARPVCEPRAVHHFTRRDQVNALVDARDSEPEIGFIMRLLALCTLPRTDPGDCDRYVKTNGPWTLVMVASGTEPHLPYGTLPRLILAWICSEAVRTKSQTLTLGRSFSDFMRSLDLQAGGGGPRSDRRRLEIQMERLLRASVELSQCKENGVYRVADHITTASDLWWNLKRPRRPGSVERHDRTRVEVLQGGR